jgi:hypothetical protein
MMGEKMPVTPKGKIARRVRGGGSTRFADSTARLQHGKSAIDQF